MAVRHYRAQLTLPNDNGLPRDAVVNTWHFLGTDAVSDAVNATDMLAQLDAFYTGWVPSWGSSAVDWANSLVKFYVFEDSPPRIPFYEAGISPGTPPSANYDYPPDVAICLSMQAERISGANMRRRRGRVYLGPVSNGTGDSERVQTSMADGIAAQADSAFFGSGLCQLAVYSPYTHHDVPVGGNIKDYPDEDPSMLLLSFHEVVRVWVDNEYDTQRRRGLKASYRKTYDK
jgi:hypothetical protein